MDQYAVERRVVIVDDSRTIQAMLDDAFSKRVDYKVVGFATDAETGAQMIRRLRPDIVTIDLCMPNLDGAALLDMISDLKYICKIVVSDSSISNMLMTAKLITAGAAACLGKSELASNPDSFFRKIAAAVEAVEKRKPVNATAPVQAKSRPNNIIEFQKDLIVTFPVPFDEAERLRILRQKGLTNAVREKHFDLITKHVAKVTSFPACLLTFIDRDTQWIKSAHGIVIESTPRELAFCNYTIAQGGSFVVTNATDDERFSNNRLVTEAPHIRSYFGHPIISNAGISLGAICVIDTRIRTTSRQTIDQLAGTAEIIAELIEQRPIAAAA